MGRTRLDVRGGETGRGTATAGITVAAIERKNKKRSMTTSAVVSSISRAGGHL